MPIPISPYPEQTRGAGSLRDINFKYKYPIGMDLKPGSNLHEKLKGEILIRARESRSAMSARYPSWRDIDQTLTAYIPIDDYEETLKSKDSRKPVSIVVPLSYAALETILSYQVAAFLESPIFRYTGMGGSEDVLGAMLMEKLIDLQANRSLMGLQIHTMLRDSNAYGFGVCTPVWTQRTGWRRKSRQTGFNSLTGNFIPTGTEVLREQVVTYEGNELFNIDPYNYLPDVNCAIQDVQRSEYVGWIRSDSRMNLLRQETMDPITFFNGRYLEFIGGKSVLTTEDRSSRDRYGVSVGSQYSSSTTHKIDVIYMYVDLIPKDWGIGQHTAPEKWMFAIAGDQVVIAASPLDLDHGMFPVVVCAPEFDGYSVSPISRVEMSYGLQKAIDFEFNCYDKDTEVLTSRGWVAFPALTINDDVATVEPGSCMLWFEKPKHVFEYDYDGWMVNFKSSRMDVCVTPNHDMLVKRRYCGEWELLPAAFVARDANFEYKTIGNLSWEGTHPSTPIRIESRGDKHYRDKPGDINPFWMASFLGWFVSEGSISHSKKSGSYNVTIGQYNEENFEEINGVMDNLPFHVCKYYDNKGDGWTWSITHRGFYEWLKENCYSGGTHSEHKKVPDFIKGWDSFHLEWFFNAAMRGDGYWMHSYSNLGKYGSKSKQLVDDMQEIALRLGYFSHVRMDETCLGDPFYVLNISTAHTNPTISPRNCSKVKYVGKVYCFENSTHLTVTRHNGKVAIHGQSRFANVRKSLNDMFVIDPQRININDVRNPAAGKIIRLRKQAWGTGVVGAIEQLKVLDVTANNFADASHITAILDRVMGSESSIQGGIQRHGERITATEFQGYRGAALTRLERAARIAALQAINPLGMMVASHTQQFMTQEQYVAIAGEYEQELREEFGDQTHVLVGPLDIAVSYDLRMHDGSLPSAGDPNAWQMMFQAVGQNPQLAQYFDVVRIFQHWARLAGAKDLSRFVNRDAKVMQDTAVQQQAQAGNLVPIGGTNGLPGLPAATQGGA